MVKFLDDYKNIRLRNYDYRNGWFFVSNKTNFSRSYLCGEVHQLVKNQLGSIGKISPGVNLDYGVIVPSHIHAVLIFDDSRLPLSEVWRRFKAKTTFLARKRLLFKDKTLWQRNYFEHVIRNEKALEKIREYIRNNPLKENLPLDEIYERI